MATPFSSYIPDEPGQAPNDTQSNIPHQSVSYNDSKFIEEDPKLIDHMDRSREEYMRAENAKKEKQKSITSEDIIEIIAANGRININFTTLINSLNQLGVSLDDCSENSFRHSNALTDIIEGKKLPVGFNSFEPKRCYSKLLELTKSLSDKMQTMAKKMEDLNAKFSQFKKNDELFRNELINRCQTLMQTKNDDSDEINKIEILTD